MVVSLAAFVLKKSFVITRGGNAGFADFEHGTVFVCFTKRVSYADLEQRFRYCAVKQYASSYGNNTFLAVLKGNNAELLDMFNKGLENIIANGKYQEILDTYISRG